MKQIPDSRSGFYYVTVRRDDGEFRPLFGPFKDDHARALHLVSKARRLACDRDRRAPWYSYGTARTDHSIGDGIFNSELTSEYLAAPSESASKYQHQP